MYECSDVPPDMVWDMLPPSLRVGVNRRSTPIARKTKRHAERIDLTNRKLQKRVRLLHIFGARQGTLYQNQREKLDVSFGYMRDGNVTHYVQVGFHGKTRDRTRY